MNQLFSHQHTAKATAHQHFTLLERRAIRPSCAQKTWCNVDSPKRRELGPPKHRRPKSKASGPATAAKELRKLAESLRKSDIAVRLRTLQESQVKHLVGAIIPLRAEEGDSPCAISDAQLHALGPQGAADALHAMARLGESHAFADEMTDILEAISFEAAWGGRRFSRQQLVDVAWALAKACHWSPKLDQLAGRMSELGGLPALRPWQYSDVLWSFAVLNHAPSALLLAGRPASTQRVKDEAIRDMSDGGLSMACWSLCVVNQHRSGWFRQAWEELAGRWASGHLQLTTHLSVRISQVARVVQLDGACESCWTPAQLELAAEAHAKQARWLELGRKGLPCSAWHRDLMQSLIGMGADFECEDISTGYPIDVGMPELKIAIEVDGPSHFSRDASRRLLGRTALKRRHLEALGWTVFSVTEADFMCAETYAAMLQQLRELLKQHRTRLEEHV